MRAVTLAIGRDGSSGGCVSSSSFALSLMPAAASGVKIDYRIQAHTRACALSLHRVYYGTGGICSVIDNEIQPSNSLLPANWQCMTALTACMVTVNKDVIKREFTCCLDKNCNIAKDNIQHTIALQVRTVTVNKEGIKRQFIPNTKLELPGEKAAAPVAIGLAA